MNTARFRPAFLAVGLTAGVVAAQPFVEDSVDVGGRWVGNLAYNSRADVVYGALPDDSVFFALDCGSLQVTPTVDGLHCPGQVVYNSVDNKAYCPFQGSLGRESLLVVDGTSHTRVRAIRLSGWPELVWSPELNRLYTLFGYSDTVAVLDCSADTVLARIRVGTAPYRACLNRTYGKLYVFTDEDTAVSIVDLATNTFKGRVYPNIDLIPAWYAESIGRFYCGGYGGIAEIDGQSDSILRRFDFPGRESAILDLPELGRLLVATSPPGTHDSVFTIDLATGVVLARLLIGDVPRRLARSPATGLVYCVNGSSDNLTVIAADGLSVVTTVRLSDAPAYIAFAPRHRRVFVSHNNTPYVYVLKDTLGIPAVVEKPRGVGKSRLSASPTHFTSAVGLPVDWQLSANQVVRMFAQDGRLVRTLSAGQGDRGTQQAVWDGRDLSGKEVLPGVYFVHNDGVRCIKIVKLR